MRGYFLLLPAVRGAGLVDAPFGARRVSYLDTAAGASWLASDGSSSITARVPGDVITDLQRVGAIGDPLYERNFLTESAAWQRDWAYSTSFATARVATCDDARVTLVLDGVKMGALVVFNGAVLGAVTDQFLRYDFDLRNATADLLKSSDGDQDNVLELRFDQSIDCDGRFMACTGGWDWAPYSRTFQGAATTFSKGVWKSVYVAAGAVYLTHLVPQIRYRGAYPVERLLDEAHGGFDVEVRVFLDCAAPTRATIRLTSAWGANATTSVDLPAGESRSTLSVRADDVALWWPSGLGAQPLYHFTVEVLTGDGVVASSRRRVGFRYFALVTGNDTDASFVRAAANETGTASHGMYFRVNGLAFWSRGANMIPMEELEGRLNADAHRRLVRSAVEGRFNTLRVWGGGVFLPDAWYDACDELGVVVYHDMQYAQAGHAPRNTSTQDAELRHQVRRLASHPSIVVWDGCNECQVVMNSSTEIYASFVLTVVAQEDASRALWPSCPARGWARGVRRLDATPTGTEPLVTRGLDARPIEVHGPYQHGTGFAAVNGATELQLFDANVPVTVRPSPVGLAHENVFASEFGTIAYSSFESMAPTLAEEHWGLHGGEPSDECSSEFSNDCNGTNVMAERNYPCDSLLAVFFGLLDEEDDGAAYLNATGADVFKRQLYQCTLAHALWTKATIEMRRSRNELGCLVWQYNEIWPTGGWGSIEYGTVGFTQGQVSGGRWKPLQYWYRRSLFADVMASCGDGGCYVRNDRAGVSYAGVVRVEKLELATHELAVIYERNATLGAGPGAIAFFELDLGVFDPRTHVLVATCFDERKTTEPISRNEIVWTTMNQLQLPPAEVTAAVADHASDDDDDDDNDDDDGVTIALHSNATALYVTLTTMASGRFEDNSFLLLPGATTRRFYPTGDLDLALLRKTLRVEHLAQNQRTC